MKHYNYFFVPGFGLRPASTLPGFAQVLGAIPNVKTASSTPASSVRRSTRRPMEAVSTPMPPVGAAPSRAPVAPAAAQPPIGTPPRSTGSSRQAVAAAVGTMAGNAIGGPIGGAVVGTAASVGVGALENLLG